MTGRAGGWCRVQWLVMVASDYQERHGAFVNLVYSLANNHEQFSTNSNSEFIT
jgi:hypothetical protein